MQETSTGKNDPAHVVHWQPHCKDAGSDASLGQLRVLPKVLQAARVHLFQLTTPSIVFRSIHFILSLIYSITTASPTVNTIHIRSLCFLLPPTMPPPPTTLP